MRMNTKQYRVSFQAKTETGYIIIDVPKAKQVLKEEYPELDLFIHRYIYSDGKQSIDGNWYISTNINGGSVASGKTQREAIDKALKLIKDLMDKKEFKTIQQMVEYIVENHNYKIDENKAKWNFEQEKIKQTYLFDDKVWYTNIPQEEYIVNLQRVITEFKNAKGKGLLYVKPKEGYDCIPIEKAIDDWEHTLYCEQETDPFKREVRSWIKFNSRERMKQMLNHFQTQLVNPNITYLNTPKQKLETNIAAIKEALRITKFQKRKS